MATLRAQPLKKRFYVPMDGRSFTTMSLPSLFLDANSRLLALHAFFESLLYLDDLMVSNANAHLDACDDPRCGDPFHAIAERTAAKEEGDRTCAPMINMVHNLILDRDMEKEQWVIHILLHSFPDFRLLFYQTTVPDIYDRYFPDENQPLPSYLARFSAVLPNTTTHQAMISADQFRRSEFSFLQNAISAVNQGQHS